MTSNRSPTQVDKLIGERIRTARLEAELSQAELGERLGVTFQQIQKYKKGVNRVSARDVVTIAEALKKPVEFFIGSLSVKVSAQSQKRASFLSTREGTQLLDSMMELPPATLQRLISLARSLT